MTTNLALIRRAVIWFGAAFVVHSAAPPLSAQQPKLLHTIEGGHTRAVMSVVFSPNGKTLASASEDKSIRLWNLATGKTIATLRGHTNTVCSVVFSPDGKILASASCDGIVRLWDVASGKNTTTMQLPGTMFCSVAFGPDGNVLAAGSAGWDEETKSYWGEVKLWDVSTGKNTTTFKVQKSGVVSVKFSPDGKTLASGGGGDYQKAERRTERFWGELKLWDLRTGKEKFALQGHTGPVSSVAFSPDGKTLASGSLDGTSKLWDTASGKNTATYTDGDSPWPVWCVAFSPNGKTLASTDIRINLWDVASGKKIASPDWIAERVPSVSFSPDGKLLASGQSDSTIKFWDVAGQRELAILEGHDGYVSSMSYSPNGKTLASASGDKTIKLWDVASGNCKATLTGHTDRVHVVAYSPDGKTLASSGGIFDKTLRLWDVASGKSTHTIKGPDNGFHSLAFSPDGRFLAAGTGGRDHKANQSWGEVHLYDVASGKNVTTYTGSTRREKRVEFTSVAFSPDGKTLASAISDRTIELWDVASGKNIASFKGHRYSTTLAVFTRNGKSVASVGFGSGPDEKSDVIWGEVKLWDAISGKNTATLQVNTGKFMSVGFLPDGKIIAAEQLHSHSIKMWDVTGSTVMASLPGHEWNCVVVLSPNGKILASGGSDKTIKLWDFPVGKAADK